MFRRASTFCGLLVAIAAGAAACGPAVDLSKALEVTDVLTGYYDDGVHQVDMNDGRGPIAANKLKPSITMRLRNASDAEITSVQIMASFWRANTDGEWDSVLVNAVSSDGLPPGEKSAPITLRTNTAYNVEGARMSLFTDHRFLDVTVRVFAKRAGGLYKLGEHKIDRVVLPHASGRGAPRP